MAYSYKEEVQECPRTYVKGVFIILGMISAFLVYLVFSNILGNNAYLSNDVSPDVAVTSNVILTEHINEEGDYEKPVCKRLEESGERYDQTETVYHGEI